MRLWKVDRCFLGPNPYSADPVLNVVWLDGDLFTKALVSGIRPMAEASSSLIGSMVATETTSKDLRMTTAAWITEWSFCLLNKERGYLKSFGSRFEDERLVSWIGYHNAKLTHAVLQFATNSLLLFSERKIDYSQFTHQIEDFLRLCRRHHPDYQAKYLMRAADLLDVPYFPAEGLMKSWQFGWGHRSIITLETGVAENSYIFHASATNKPVTKTVLRSLGLPVGREKVVDEERQLEEAIQDVEFPCVTKPTDGKQSQNTTVDIRSHEQLLKGFNYAKEYNGGSVIVEQMLAGDVHRLMIMQGEFFCSIRRTPASVTGDGVSTIEDLLETNESERQADPIRSMYTGPVPIDEELMVTLAEAGMNLKSIIPKGQVLRVRKLPRSMRGGILTDVTDATHQDVKQMAMSITKAMRLSCAGIDYITQDISQPPTSTCGFIEVNTIPSLSIALGGGISLEDCGRAFFHNKANRIPTKLTLYSSQNIHIGAFEKKMASGDGWVHGTCCGIGNVRLKVENATIFKCVKTVLRNPLAQRIDIKMTMDDVLRFGLPLDRFDEISIQYDEREIPSEWKSVIARSTCNLRNIKFTSSS
jgi:D-alanine-D-alanine ligase-like ATP-grasp enzyme